MNMMEKSIHTIQISKSKMKFMKSKVISFLEKIHVVKKKCVPRHMISIIFRMRNMNRDVCVSKRSSIA